MIAIMNNYAVSKDPEGEHISRGRLVLSLAGKRSLRDAARELQLQLFSDKYAPFYLFMLGFRSQEMWSWDGIRLRSNTPCPNFWTTSSFHTSQVAKWRTRRWEQRTGSRTISLDEARSILSERGEESAYSFTMDRADARTVSQSAIRLDPEGMQFAYAERQADGSGYSPPVACCW